MCIQYFLYIFIETRKQKISDSRSVAPVKLPLAQWLPHPFAMNGCEAPPRVPRIPARSHSSGRHAHADTALHCDTFYHRSRDLPQGEKGVTEYTYVAPTATHPRVLAYTLAFWSYLNAGYWAQHEKRCFMIF